MLRLKNVYHIERKNVPKARCRNFTFFRKYRENGLVEVKDTDSDEWTRVSVTITIASQTEVTTAFFLDNMQGWAYFSCFQLEKSAAANKFNMLRNAFFEEAFNATGENGWKLSQGESADQIVTDSVKGKCARLRGNLSKNKNLMQTVKVSGKEGDVFVFGCSVKADAIPAESSVFVQWFILPTKQRQRQL